MRTTAKFLVGFTGFAIAVTACAFWLAPRAIAQARAALVRDVDQPANAPFAWETFSFASSSDPVMHGGFTVPTTAEGRTVQRLVIEGVTTLCNGLPSPAPGVRVLGPAATAGIGSSTNVEYFLPFLAGPDPTSFVLQAQTRIHVNPGAGVFINLLEFENSAVCSLSMVGHFVTL